MNGGAVDRNVDRGEAEQSSLAHSWCERVIRIDGEIEREEGRERERERDISPPTSRQVSVCP